MPWLSFWVLSKTLVCRNREWFAPLGRHLPAHPRVSLGRRSQPMYICVYCEWGSLCGLCLTLRCVGAYLAYTDKDGGRIDIVFIEMSLARAPPFRRLNWSILTRFCQSASNNFVIFLPRWPDLWMIGTILYLYVSLGSDCVWSYHCKHPTLFRWSKKGVSHGWDP